MEENSSLEELAGMPEQSSSEDTQPEQSVEPSQEPPAEVPPVPDEGLPEGWTMDQWKWYGAEWLAKQGK